MNSIKDFLESLGGLHDSCVEKIVWQPSEGIFEFHFNDLYWNFEGMPEYPGPKPGTIVFREVEQVRFEFDSSVSVLNVDEFSAQIEDDGKLMAKVKFWPSGSIAFAFKSSKYPENELLKK